MNCENAKAGFFIVKEEQQQLVKEDIVKKECQGYIHKYFRL